MMRSCMSGLLTLAVALVVQVSALARPGQENGSQLDETCRSKLEVACEQLRMGLQAYREARFAEAAFHFTNAADLDPSFLQAHVYLGTALAEQYIPGLDSPENLRRANQAIAAFEAALKLDAQNATALATIALVYYELKQFEKAKEFQQRRIDADPANPEPYYWIGVLDWALCFPRQMKLRKDLNLDSPRDPKKPTMLPPLPEDARDRLASENGDAVEEGIRDLEKVIELKPDDFDAMAYLNLLYRQKADLEVAEDARQNDLRIADGWVNKAVAIRRKNASPPSGQEGPRQQP